MHVIRRVDLEARKGLQRPEAGRRCTETTETDTRCLQDTLWMAYDGYMETGSTRMRSCCGQLGSRQQQQQQHSGNFHSLWAPVETCWQRQGRDSCIQRYLGGPAFRVHSGGTLYASTVRFGVVEGASPGNLLCY